MEYELKDLSPEEALQVTKELQDVLAKYECEMGTSTTITIFKRVPKEVTATDVSGAVLSHIQDVRPDDETTDNPEATPA